MSGTSPYIEVSAIHIRGLTKEMAIAQTCCVECHTKKETKDARALTMKNGKLATQGAYPSCGTKMFRIGKA